MNIEDSSPPPLKDVWYVRSDFIMLPVKIEENACRVLFEEPHHRINMSNYKKKIIQNKNCRAIGLPQNFEINILKIIVSVSFFILI